jgi:transcriptional regulator with PAS, ATPase and Fis domain
MIAASVFGHAGATSQRVPTSDPPSVPAPGKSLAEVERAHIERVLSQMQGNVTRAAQALGIDRRTLQRKLRAYGLGE